MNISVDVWLRGDDFATTSTMGLPVGAPGGWGDDDVRLILGGMLRAMYRQKYPDREERETIAFRGLSWIVNPFDEGGVVIAIEITLGAAIAGPIDIDKSSLEAMITRIVTLPVPMPQSTPSIH